MKTASAASAGSGLGSEASDESEEEDDMFAPKVVYVPKSKRETMTTSELEVMMREQCDELCEFFETMSTEDAEMVLRHFGWELDLEKIGDLMDQGYDENKFREVSGLLPTNHVSQAPAPVGTRMCEICVDEKDASEFPCLGCCHFKVCNSCWLVYLEGRSGVGVVECLNTPCIGHSKYSRCGLIVPQHFFKKFASTQTFNLYTRRRYEEFVMNNKKRVMAFCPGPDCDRICVADPGMKTKEVIMQSLPVSCRCDLGTYCMGCVKLGDANVKPQIHAPATCKNVADWTKKTTEEGRYFTFRIKHCPNNDCRAAIVKCGCQGKIVCNNLDHCPNQACNHMHCRNCDTHFCWICGNLWADHNSYYSCNKQLSQDLTPIEFFKGCLERYDDHMKSHRLTRERVGLSSQMYEHFRLKRPSCIQNDVFTESNEEMSKCYVILAFSYIRRHYTVFAHEAMKSLYEVQQGMLENYTNQLMGKYESFKKKFEANSDADSDESMKQEFILMREFTKSLQTWRSNLLESFCGQTQDPERQS